MNWLSVLYTNELQKFGREQGTKCSLRWNCQGNYIYTYKSEIIQEYGTQDGTKINVIYKLLWVQGSLSGVGLLRLKFSEKRTSFPGMIISNFEIPYLTAERISTCYPDGKVRNFECLGVGWGVKAQWLRKNKQTKQTKTLGAIEESYTPHDRK